MIAKRIKRDKATSDFARLGRYVVDARGGIAPDTWSRTADYILDTAQDGAKVGGVRVTNCGTDDPADAVASVLAVQARNTRSKADKSYHLVISFPQGERPSLETLHAIEDRLVAAIGMADHQRISAVHTDTEHLHVHVAINKVNPTTFNNVEPYYDMPRLMEMCERIEIEYGLQRTNHGLLAVDENSIIINRPELDHDRYNRSERLSDGDLGALRESYLAALEQQPEAESLDRVRSLSSLRVVHLAQGPEMLLPGDAPAHVEHGGAERDDQLRRRGDGQRGPRGQGDRADGEGSQGSAQAPDGGLSGIAGDMEAHAGRESLLGWIKRQATPAIAGADGWPALHAALAEHGLVIKPQGAGLVIGTADGRINVKASQVARSLSLKALTDRFGVFTPPAVDPRARAPRAEYRTSPKHKHVDTAALFQRYQRDRNVAIANRKQEREALRAGHEKYAAALTRWYTDRRTAIQRGPLRGAAKRDAYAALIKERDADFTHRRALEAQQRETIAARNPQPTWQEYLVKLADAGDESALAVLRSRDRKKQRFVSDWLSADNIDKAKDVIRQHMSPRTAKDGSVRYDVPDGGVVNDMRDGVRVDSPTDAASFLALVLAAERFEGQALIVEGSDLFKGQVAKLAGAKGLAVQFADAELERIRRMAEPAAPTVPVASVTQPTPAKAAEPPSTEALQAFVEARNLQRERVASIPPHRAWAEADAGDAVYQGRRKLGDGSEAVLLQKGDTMLVKAVTSDQAAKASRLKPGTTVAIDARGRFLSQSRQSGPKR